MSAVTAAVVGVVLNLAVWFGLHVIFPGDGTVDSFAILVGTVLGQGRLCSQLATATRRSRKKCPARSISELNIQVAV
jgi:hypothetical protein